MVYTVDSGFMRVGMVYWLVDVTIVDEGLFGLEWIGVTWYGVAKWFDVV